MGWVLSQAKRRIALVVCNGDNPPWIVQLERVVTKRIKTTPLGSILVSESSSRARSICHCQVAVHLSGRFSFQTFLLLRFVLFGFVITGVGCILFKN